MDGIIYNWMEEARLDLSQGCINDLDYFFYTLAAALK